MSIENLKSHAKYNKLICIWPLYDVNKVNQYVEVILVCL
jgi:hypothetical protein